MKVEKPDSQFWRSDGGLNFRWRKGVDRFEFQ